jgi:hypothetical protein
MAREFAQIKLAIWADDDWRDLSPLARYLYLTLLTSPTLSHCGVADWRPTRIGALNGMDPHAVADFGAELIEALYLVIDTESEEVLIRSFIRNDGLMKQPKMAVAMASAHAGVASQVIRGVIVHELNRLCDDFPDLNGWGSDRATELLGMRSIDPSTYPLGKGNRTPFGKGSRKGSPTPAPTPTTTPSNQQTSGITTPDASMELAPTIRQDVEQVCEHLAGCIEANGSKRPEITKRWRDAARLMLDKDGRGIEEIHGAIDWCQRDEFWRANVMSMPTLREKFDQLRLQAQRQPKGIASRSDEWKSMQERQMARAIEREREMGIR